MFGYLRKKVLCSKRTANATKKLLYESAQVDGWGTYPVVQLYLLGLWPELVCVRGAGGDG